MIPTFLGSRQALGFALMMTVLGPQTVLAQSELAASEAAAFLGQWRVSIDSEYGPFTLELDIVDQDGMVAARVGSPEMGSSQEVTDVSREGDDLLLRYEAEYEGQYFPVIIDLAPDGDGLSVGFDAADGQFFARGHATRTDR